MSIILTLVIFTIIVVIHEAGHMLVAKRCNVLVEEFAIGMGPKLFGFKKGETLYSIRLLPIGGYCRMADDVGERTDFISFTETSPLQRIAICFFGPLMNFVLALLIMIAISTTMPISTTNITEIMPNSPAYNSGLLVGDKITAVEGRGIRDINDFSFYAAGEGTKEITVKRDNKLLNIQITPILDDNNEYKYGFALELMPPYFDISNKYADINEEKGNIGNYIISGYNQTISLIKMTFYGFLDLVTSKTDLSQLSGPIGVNTLVSDIYSKTTDTNNATLLRLIIIICHLMALLSANLGVINLLPIPALDGGRIILAFIELIIRRKLPNNIESLIHITGFALIMGLGIYIAFNDILKLI